MGFDLKKCSVDGCDRPHLAKGLCQMHYTRVRRTGATGPADMQKAAAGTGQTIGRNGYVVLQRPGHPLADSQGRVYEHRLVAWEAGLLTDLGMDVHHVNRDRTDNRLENLRVLTRKEHRRLHGLGVCSVYGCDRDHYGNGLCNMHYQRMRRLGKVTLSG